MSTATAGALRRVLEDARTPGVPMADLTVLAVQNDPYRVDTPAGHRDGQWFAEQFTRAGRERIHLRGLHYAIVATGDVLKPDSSAYRNTDSDWVWLQSRAAKAARWLGYVPFDAITDERNEAPALHRAEVPEDPWPYVYCDVDIEIPDADELRPAVGVADFTARQPYNLVLFGEKSSLADVLRPIAESYGADLYLPSGEISDSQLHQMASTGAQDGRPMRVFTIADFDPAGHQMPISIGRKLQAFRDMLFDDLDFEVRPVALTAEQVHELNLPSTPLKETERRADAWREAFGVEQTEVDALATLRPDVLARIVRDALDPFHDPDLEERVREAKKAWIIEAQRVVDEHTDGPVLDAIHAEASVKLAKMEGEVDALREGLRQAVPRGLTAQLPPVEIPKPDTDPSMYGKPLIASSWSWAEQTWALRDRKSYAGGVARNGEKP